MFVRLLRYFCRRRYGSLTGDVLILSIVDRWGFDIVSGYKHKPIPPNSNMSLEELRKGGYVMDEHAWLNVSLTLTPYL